MSLANFVNQASQNQVLIGLASIKSANLPQNRLLRSGNQFEINAVSCVENHFSNLTLFSQDDARTYLAASSFMHCFDGWQYLSQAIDSLLKGDARVAIHLSYYAELRAAMSFLSSEGIGVLSTVHFCQDNNGNAIKDPFSNYNANRRKWNNGSGTHSFVWNCLSEWISLTSKSTIDLLDCFSHNGKTFKEWLSNIPNSNSITVLSPIIKQWLSKWTFDIQNFVADREGRNNASYRPSILPTYVNNDLRQSIEEYASFLSLLEPVASNRFSLLDKYLFKLFFVEVHQTILRNGITITLEQLLDQTFQNLGLPMDIGLKSIILSSNEHPLFIAAHNTLVGTHGDIIPLNIFARALLMLRISTGRISAMFRNANISQSELNFLTSYIGIKNGFWKVGEHVADFETLWGEVGDSIIDIRSWLGVQPSPLCLKDFNDTNSTNLICFRQINRASLWGIAI